MQRDEHRQGHADRDGGDRRDEQVGCDLDAARQADADGLEVATEDRADRVLDDDLTPNAATKTVKNAPSWRWIGR
jgi:hypothetical protein